MATTPPNEQPERRHYVFIHYKDGKVPNEDPQLVVSGYPPGDLQLGDQIVFFFASPGKVDAESPGKLTLTFPKGSNFAEKGQESPIEIEKNGERTLTVERLMTWPELNELQQDERDEYGLASSQYYPVCVVMNAFPFSCEREGVVSDSYEIGFPYRPRR
jgi:hypothetical protein